ncbi:PulJ/GspJ family protein [Coraliomargarita parva]|uniref:PulJ/GspJ family protein n=1 Tax=Coraliomargarita parva TaxID=3014050 RepID=UPI0022B50423|nr:prepilin-type N-terminal cleavage/methylation domain-containing protein [Coraliomargarita parva]
MKNKIQSHSTRHAFTLIEILVATVIMVIMVGLVIKITGDVLKVWNRASGKLSANAEARIAMDLITQDLETVVMRNNGQQWLRIEAPEDPGGYYTNQTVALKLFAPALDRPKKDTSGNEIPGDICAIAYRLSFKESYPGGENVYALYRYIADPKYTFESLMGSTSDSSSPQESLTGGVWDEANVTNDENYLAGNIVEFKVLLYEDDGVTPPTACNANSLMEVTTDYAYGGLNGSTTPILYADIILTIVSDEGLEIMKNIADNRAGTGYTGSQAEQTEAVVREYGDIFTRRVNFMAHPL